MITIFYPRNGFNILGCKERLDRALLKYELVMVSESTEARLVDGETEVEGMAAIEAYLEREQQFVNSWYEDRCDVYDFDPDPIQKGDDVKG